MRKLFWLLFLVPLAAMGENSWIDEIECSVELIRMETFITDQTVIVSGRRFPLSPVGHQGEKRGSGRFDFSRGVSISFEVELQKENSQWSRYGDRLVVKSWFLQDDTVYSYDETNSDQVGTYYHLRMAKEQKEQLFTINYMVNPAITQHLFEEKTSDGAWLLKEGIVKKEVPYKGHLVCRLWRPHADPSSLK